MELDKNLQLALLDEIQEDREWIDEMGEDYEKARLNNPEWASWEEIEENESENNSSLEEFLLTLSLADDKLLEIESLTLDGDREMYNWVCPEWWEYGDKFVIRNLSGIEKCQSLQYLHLGQGLMDGCSLKPLKALQQLSELWICATGNYSDIDTLLDLPNLQKIELSNWETNEDREIWQRVIEKVNSRS